MATVEKRGPKVTETAIGKIEARVGAPLPSDYRRFLLQSNGGVPTPDVIDVEGLPGSPTDVQVFFGIGRSVESSCLDWNLATLAGRLEAGLLPIACDSGGNVFCLSLRQPELGSVLYCDLQAVFGDLKASPELFHVSSSFRSFMDKLRELD